MIRKRPRRSASLDSPNRGRWRVPLLGYCMTSLRLSLAEKQILDGTSYAFTIFSSVLYGAKGGKQNGGERVKKGNTHCQGIPRFCGFWCDWLHFCCHVNGRWLTSKSNVRVPSSVVIIHFAKQVNSNTEFCQEPWFVYVYVILSFQSSITYYADRRGSN